jgi:hypothetical protein
LPTLEHEPLAEGHEKFSIDIFPFPVKEGIVFDCEHKYPPGPVTVNVTLIFVSVLFPKLAIWAEISVDCDGSIEDREEAALLTLKS